MTNLREGKLNWLLLDSQNEVERVVEFIKRSIMSDLRRGGCVLGVSGGIDSAVVFALCLRAFGEKRVIPVFMPESESDPQSLQFAEQLCNHSGVDLIHENISNSLDGFGCYQRRDVAIARLVPEYDASKGFKSKIILPDNLLEEGSLNIFSLIVVDPSGEEHKVRLPIKEFREIVAASNFKQRARMTMLYYHAELRNYAVVGTANKNEHDLGFFVKYGDGGADLQPIAHLFKTQIYQLAKFLDIPASIRARVPATDTYSAGGSQQEFFFRIPFEILDHIWFGFENNVPHQKIAQKLNLTVQQVERVVDDIQRKQQTTAYLRTMAQSLE